MVTKKKQPNGEKTRKKHRLTKECEANIWQPGQTGNPNGRPKGARSKLSETFLKDLYEDFQENGMQAIVDVRENDPSVYIRVIASIVPKELTINEGETAIERILAGIPDERLSEFVDGIRLLTATAKGGKGGTQKVIEQRPNSVH